MPNESRELDKQQPLQLTTDFRGESRHDFVAKLAYKLWEQRGRPLGSPDVDWFAAEQALYVSLAASRLIDPLPIDPQHMREKICR